MVAFCWANDPTEWAARPRQGRGCAPAIDSGRLRVYIPFMAENTNTTFEQELKRLEQRVDALVKVCDQLQDENKSLKQRQDVLTAERANLLQKNEQVRARVEAMIGRLKAMEQGT
jgi:cell division protein ZapB